ncbi:MAG: Fe-S protein assembly co-chaperone HscB [Pseudomonadota bacterium]|nr:Fe-S protein assembly co-chaperone HscB [Pseudomonadota bacterium]
MHYFTLLNLPPTFDLDLSALESAYFTAQRQYHPDRFVGKPPSERTAALQHSADINKAYDTLKDPLKRAQYLLHLQGIAVGTEADSVKPSQEILVEAMELREEPPPKEKLEKMIAASIAAIGNHYQAKAFPQMAQETLRLGYLVNLRKS